MRSTRSTTGAAAMGWLGEEFLGGLGEFGASLDFVVVGLGVFDQRGSGADLAVRRLAASRQTEAYLRG